MPHHDTPRLTGPTVSIGRLDYLSVGNQTPAFDPTDAEPIPDFVFDQSLPDELDNWVKSRVVCKSA